MPPPPKRLKVLTWHIHGSYLSYLSRIRHQLYVPVKPGRPLRYGGRAPGMEWPDNLHEVPADQVRRLDLDCILFQAQENYLEDQFEILSDAQRRLPSIYLEHDPPRRHQSYYSFDGRHPVDDPHVLLVHVTHFNELMWDSGRTPTTVIEHGVAVPEGVRFEGDLPRGITVVNGLPGRGRRLGADVFELARRQVPLDLVGMGSEGMGGLGEVPHGELARFEARYRFFFNPIRYTSLGLAVCEAMMVGMPIIGLATTEMASVVENGVSGYVDTDLDALVGRMQDLLGDQAEARRLGEGARRAALERFGIERFVGQWEQLLDEVVDGRMVTLGALVEPASRGPEPASVDVLIPTCDRPAALAVTLTSLASQTFDRFRVIVSDQGDEPVLTSGEAAAVVRVLEAKGRQVEVLRNLPRRGMAQQRQFLLDRAQARYVLYLDDDVILEPDLLERLVETIGEQRCGFVGSALIGLSHADDERPEEQHVEFWDGDVRPEEVKPGSAEWERYVLHNAANLYHLQERLGLSAAQENEVQRPYKVAWVGGCVLYDASALREVGGFRFHDQLPTDHAGEEVVAQVRVMASHGGCALLPSGAYHQELPTRVEDRSCDAPQVLL